MKRPETLGRRERALVEERRQTGYRVERLTRFAEFEPTLRALLARLLPGTPGTIDLGAFVDSHAEHSLGRGDRKPGLPPPPDLLREGLNALTSRGFATLDVTAQEALIGRMRRGEADMEFALEAKEFIDRLLVLACAGYLAHPDAWQRIGFNGPAYPEGYAWISKGAAARRDEGFAGAGRL
ncbi:MAG: gluconate 2-dehydrogenase subunit 3 family protein [Actinomycetota bacterium]|nr:gluconate 2-dehydrogenase subunit 3 family protein [Actinomycetota bacterium]